MCVFVCLLASAIQLEVPVGNFNCTSNYYLIHIFFGDSRSTINILSCALLYSHYSYILTNVSNCASFGKATSYSSPKKKQQS